MEGLIDEYADIAGIIAAITAPGAPGLHGLDGLDGLDGEDGAPGDPGAPGPSYTVAVAVDPEYPTHWIPGLKLQPRVRRRVAVRSLLTTHLRYLRLCLNWMMRYNTCR